MSHLGYNVFSSTVDGDNTADHIYYSATIINNRTSINAVQTNDPQVRFQETRDTPLVTDASKYNFSIIRFTLNGPNKDLPLFIPVIRTGAANPGNNVDLTIYSVSIKLIVSNTTGANPVNATLQALSPCIWVTQTQDTNVAPPPDPSTCQTGQDLSTRYYWCYDYTHWLDIVNTAFTTAIASLQTQFQAAWTAAGNVGVAPTLGTSAPYITYNPTNNLFSLYADRYGFGGSARTSAGSTANENATLYFNSNMFGMFAGFDNVYVNLPNEQTNEIKVYPILYQNIVAVASPPAPAAKSYWVMAQNYESTSTLWSPVDSIVFVSNLLPLVFENVGEPIKFGEGNDNALNTDQGNFAPIITDIALTNQNAHDYREFILYSPLAEYRLLSFQRSKTAINNIDIQVYWRNRLDNKLYPLQMFNGSSVSIKMLFRRRGIWNYPHPASAGVNV
jgi:hypothetical protein